MEDPTMNRTSKIDYFLRIAEVVASRATCLRRAVGCVLTNSRGHIRATGYNGRAAGLPHCLNTGGEHDHACHGAQVPSGTDLDACEAIHAEQNALLQCPNVFDIVACYVTVSPCVTCVKLLMNTSCRAIYFRDEYAHNEEAKRLWLSNSERVWVMVPPEKWSDVYA